MAPPSKNWSSARGSIGQWSISARRPRKTLEFMTPSEKFAEAVATTR
jgi:IS30 family transposase